MGWKCSFSHTLREGNFCADALAKLGCDLDQDFEVLREPLANLESMLSVNRWGLSFS
ncbi:hypothetical protein REPUB_Repub19eG0116500 [Reevesia pubescens]